MSDTPRAPTPEATAGHCRRCDACGFPLLYSLNPSYPGERYCPNANCKKRGALTIQAFTTPAAQPVPPLNNTRTRFHVGHVMALSIVISEAALSAPTGDERADTNLQNALVRAHEVLWYMEQVFGKVESERSAAAVRTSPADEIARLTSSLAEAEKARDRFQWLSQNADAIRQSMFDTGAENDKLRASLKDAERDTARLARADREKWAIAPQVGGGWVICETYDRDMSGDAPEGREIARTRGTLMEALDVATAFSQPTQEQADR